MCVILYFLLILPKGLDFMPKKGLFKTTVVAKSDINLCFAKFAASVLVVLIHIVS